jgi:hypothetical protein
MEDAISGWMVGRIERFREEVGDCEEDETWRVEGAMVDG